MGARPHDERITPNGAQGQSPLEAEALLVFEGLMEAANLPTFLKFENANKS